MWGEKGLIKGAWLLGGLRAGARGTAQANSELLDAAAAETLPPLDRLINRSNTSKVSRGACPAACCRTGAWPACPHMLQADQLMSPGGTHVRATQKANSHAPIFLVMNKCVPTIVDRHLLGLPQHSCIRSCFTARVYLCAKAFWTVLVAPMEKMKFSPTFVPALSIL